MAGQVRSRTLRDGMVSQPGQIYLVTATTLDRHPVFNQFVLGRLLVREMRQADEAGLVQSLAWVVMPDHMHWLFELRTHALAGVMRSVKSRAAISVNRASGREGRLWQDGYHDRAVRTEQDVINVARYIIANPLRAGLVKNVRNYPLWDAIWI